MMNNWGSIKDTPLNQLVIPGSHNAGTYGLGDSKLDDLTQAVFSFAREGAEN